jgi:hypothetical protein
MTFRLFSTENPPTILSRCRRQVPRLMGPRRKLSRIVVVVDASMFPLSINP